MKKNILVTAVGGRSVGSGILHSLTRSSPEVTNRWNVIAADADPFAWGLYITNQSTLLPLADSPDYIAALNKVIHKYKIDAVIPGSELESTKMASILNEIAAPVICNRAELMPLMMDKFYLAKKLKEMGFPYIETIPFQEWERAVEMYDFPFIVKPTEGTGGSRGLRLVGDKAELLSLINSISFNTAYCIQPYIGTENQEYTVGVITDKNGALIDSIVMHRKLTGLSLLESKKYNGNTFSISTGYSQGIFIKHTKIQSFCEKLANTLNSRGPLNIQLRIDKGELYVFEIHPRFSGTSTIRADIGFNEADILLRNVLYGEQFGRLPYQYDVAAIRTFEHVIVPIDKMIKE